MDNNTSQQGVQDILPDFEWIDIPRGIVVLEGAEGSYIPEGQQKGDFILAFTISKYPITNKQYAEYVKETGNKPTFWQWEDNQFNQPMQPVVGVKWHDAIAFCNWLSEKSGEKISLPTEQQWQRAAQGDDGRIYPWGNQWDASRCNSKSMVSRPSSTTPVTAYEGKGDSPYGVVDMSGNVWEWCLTVWETGSNDVNETNVTRVVRGGSWLDRPALVRLDYRYNDDINGYRNDGFRLCVDRSHTSS